MVKTLAAISKKQNGTQHPCVERGSEQPVTPDSGFKALICTHLQTHGKHLEMHLHIQLKNNK